MIYNSFVIGKMFSFNNSTIINTGSMNQHMAVHFNSMKALVFVSKLQKELLKTIGKGILNN